MTAPASTVCSCICGDTFPRHPALEIDCPSCTAKVGQLCRRPSEHVLNIYNGFAELHAKRRKAAWAANPCSCLAQWEARQKKDLLGA